jgi:hypothetical protein
MERYAYSIWPVVSFMPWFRRFDGDRVHRLRDKQDDGQLFMPQE